MPVVVLVVHLLLMDMGLGKAKDLPASRTKQWGLTSGTRRRSRPERSHLVHHRRFAMMQRAGHHRDGQIRPTAMRSRRTEFMSTPFSGRHRDGLCLRCWGKGQPRDHLMSTWAAMQAARGATGLRCSWKAEERKMKKTMKQTVQQTGADLRTMSRQALL